MRETAMAPFASLGACLLAIFLALAPPALAIPFHPRDESRDVTGLNHACGAAVDSKGDLYLSSAGESKVKVYDPSHALLTEISDANAPCGLAVTTAGDLYVSERATGNVVKFHPSEYPPTLATTYTETTIDSSTKAKGIAVDRFDNRLYVAEGDRVSSYGAAGSLGINEVQRVFMSIFEVTGGTFKLEFGGKKTEAIAFNASAEVVQKELETLSTIGAGNISVTKPKELEYLVTFIGALAHTDVELIIGDSSELTGGPNKAVKVEEKEKGWSGRIGEGTLTEATGVAPFTYPTATSQTDRYLAVADAAGLAEDGLRLFGGQDIRTLKQRREVSGAATPDGSFVFGAAGAYLAADPGNRSSDGKCPAVGEQACTAGHLFLYDAAHKSLDEFDATGEFLDRTRNAAFAEGEPTAVAIDRSGTAGDGTLYLTAGSAAGAKALAFGPLKAPKRATLAEPVSKILPSAGAVATDSHGYVYVVTGSLIHVYKPDGGEILTGGTAPLEDTHAAGDLAVDSSGKVYVLDQNNGSAVEGEVSYYTPSAYPPVTGTTYTRHEPAVAKATDFPAGKEGLKGIAVDPGPGAGKDRLFLTSSSITHVYKSAQEGSGLLAAEFAKGVVGLRESIAVDGARDVVYFGTNPKLIYRVDTTGEETLARIQNSCPPSGKFDNRPNVAVDQANGHVLAFDGKTPTVREYDAAGSCVAEFGNFTESLIKPYRVALDSACAIHEPPLTGEACKAFDPADGTVYVAFDDTKSTHPPYDLTAFGPLTYATPAKHKLTVKKTGTGSGKVESTSPASPKIICGTECEKEFDETEVVTLTAEAGAGSEFIGWSGCEAEPSLTECEVTSSKDREVVVIFDLTPKPKFKLTVTKSGTGSGTVSGGSVAEPGTISCGTGSGCEHEYEEGTVVTLSQSADPGSEFKGWTGCTSEEAGNCKVTISAAKGVTATFDAEEEPPTGPPLTVIIEEGAGTVTGPGGFECSGTALHECTTEAIEAGSVTLKASPSAGNVFKGWSGCTTHVGLTCGLTLSVTSKPIKVKFTPTSSLSITKAGSGAGKVGATGISCDESCSAATSEIANGKSVTVKTKPAYGSEAAVLESGTGSAGSCSGSECTFTISADSSLVVKYVAKPTKTLTLDLTGSAYNKGKVKAKAFVKGLLKSSFSCGSGCTTTTESFFSSDELELTAAAPTGYTFEGWNVEGGSAGTCTGKALVCKLLSNANKTIKAEFK